MKEATEIKELDMNKHLVLKKEDLSWLSERERDMFFEAIEKIDNSKKRVGKQDNKYLVLNLDDEIDLSMLSVAIKTQTRIYEANKMQAHVDGKICFDDVIEGFSIPKCKVSDIALALVNAIQKAKEKPCIEKSA